MPPHLIMFLRSLSFSDSRIRSDASGPDMISKACGVKYVLCGNWHVFLVLYPIHVHVCKSMLHVKILLEVEICKDTALRYGYPYVRTHARLSAFGSWCTQITVIFIQIHHLDLGTALRPTRKNATVSLSLSLPPPSLACAITRNTSYQKGSPHLQIPIGTALGASFS
jgi:hypothetical protein